MTNHCVVALVNSFPKGTWAPNTTWNNKSPNACLCQVHPKKMSKLLLPHDKARPYTSVCTTNVIQNFGQAVLSYPSYSPHLALSDYRLHGPLKKSLRGYNYINYQVLQNAMHKWLQRSGRNFCQKGILLFFKSGRIRWQRWIPSLKTTMPWTIP